MQLGLFPFPGPGWVLNELLDVAVAGTLVALVGWNWAFLPSFLAESLPVVDVVPSWTAAVLFATRHGATAPAPPPPAGEKLAGSGSTTAPPGTR